MLNTKYERSVLCDLSPISEKNIFQIFFYEKFVSPGVWPSFGT